MAKKVYLETEEKIQDLVEASESIIKAFVASVNACLSNLEIGAATSQWTEALKANESLKQHVDALCAYGEALKPSMRVPRQFGSYQFHQPSAPTASLADTRSVSTEKPIAENVRKAQDLIDKLGNAVWQSSDRLVPPGPLQTRTSALCDQVDVVVNTLLKNILGSTFKLFFTPRAPSEQLNGDAISTLADMLKTVPRVHPVKGSSRRRARMSPSPGSSPQLLAVPNSSTDESPLSDFVSISSLLCE